MAAFNIESKLTELSGAVASYRDRTEKRMVELQSQVDAIDARGVTRFSGDISKSFFQTLKENDSISRLMTDKKGRAVINFDGAAAQHLLERKTTITSGAGGTVGTSTTGVLQIERLPGITSEARQQLTVRDALYARKTNFQVIDYVKVSTPMTIASPVPEASTKPENAVGFISASERVKTIATWIPASKQVLDDWSELESFLQTTLGYYVDLEEEQQLLSGSGTGENLNGLITQASMFSVSLLSAARGWTKIDQIGRTVQQITASREMPPTFVVLNPNDWWDIRLTKDGYGRYILGDPQNGAYASMAFGSLIPIQALFNLQVIPTNSIATGTYLVGSGSPIASAINDRMELAVEISTEHSTYFTQNLIAIRAEKRLCLVVRRPASYVTGSFTSSPA